MTERHERESAGDRIILLKGNLEMRKRVLDGMRQSGKSFGTMTPESVEAEIEDIKRQLRELGVDPDEQQT